VTTTVGAAAITGCQYLGGAPSGVTLDGGTDAADYHTGVTPIIPYAPSLGGGGDPGGYGNIVRELDHAGEMWAAGFRLQEQLIAWMNGSQDLKILQIAPFYANYDLNENFNFPDLALPPPSALLGPGQIAVGPPRHLASITSPGTGSVIDERAFEKIANNWADLNPALAPTKRIMKPILYGKMPADAKDI
jgi:hypothetical protein